MQGHAAWREQQERRERRTRSIREAGIAASTVLAPGALWLQLTFGQLRGYIWSATAADATLVSALALAASITIMPERTLKAVEKTLNMALRAVIVPAAAAIITAAYLCSLPAARTYGRRKLAAAHPGMRPWMDGRAEWRREDTWREKVCLEPHEAEGNAALSLLRMFMMQRNWLLAAMLLIMLSAAALLALASPSSPIAPLLYTLF